MSRVPSDVVVVVVVEPSPNVHVRSGRNPTRREMIAYSYSAMPDSGSRTLSDSLGHTTFPMASGSPSQRVSALGSGSKSTTGSPMGAVKSVPSEYPRTVFHPVPPGNVAVYGEKP